MKKTGGSIPCKNCALSGHRGKRASMVDTSNTVITTNEIKLH